MLIEGADYFVRMVDFPTNNGGAVVPNDDGTYSVYINERLDSVRQRRALEHEREHIERDDLNAPDISEAEGLKTIKARTGELSGRGVFVEDKKHSPGGLCNGGRP